MRQVSPLVCGISSSVTMACVSTSGDVATITMNAAMVPTRKTAVGHVTCTWRSAYRLSHACSAACSDIRLTLGMQLGFDLCV